MLRTPTATPRSPRPRGSTACASRIHLIAPVKTWAEGGGRSGSRAARAAGCGLRGIGLRAGGTDAVLGAKVGQVVLTQDAHRQVNHPRAERAALLEAADG